MNSIQKSKKWTVGIVLLMATLFCAPGLAGAFGGKHHQGKGFGMKNQYRMGCNIWRNQKLVQDLGLSDDQINKLKDVDFTFRENQLKIRSQMETLQLQMDKEFSSDTVKEESVRKAAKKLSALRGEKYVQEVESTLAVRKILTPDQLKKLKSYRMNQRQKRPGCFQGKGFGKERGNCPKNRPYRGGDDLTK